MKIILEVLIQGWMYWHYSLPTLPERKTFVSRSNRPPLYRGICSQPRTVLVLVGRQYSCMNCRPYPSLPEEEHIQPSKRVDGREGVLDTDIDCFCVLGGYCFPRVVEVVDVGTNTKPTTNRKLATKKGHFLSSLCWKQ